MSVALRGIGEYPGYYCYDAARPAWLPYWLDDFTESACKYNPKTISGNIYSCATGDPNCGTPTPGQIDPTLPGAGTAPAGTPPGQTNALPNCTGFQSYNVTTQQCEFDPSRPSFMILAAGLLAVVLLIKK